MGCAMTDTIPDAVIEAMAADCGCTDAMVRYALRAAEAAGWVLVPVEPTEAMAAKAPEVCFGHGDYGKDIGVWGRMLAARPKVPE